MKALVFLVLVMAGAVIVLYLWPQSGRLRGQAQAAVVGEICSTDVLQEVLANYPQASMTKEQLGQMSLGKEIGSLLSFQAKLPTMLDPSASRLHASDPSTWGYLVKFS